MGEDFQFGNSTLQFNSSRMPASNNANGAGAAASQRSGNSTSLFHGCDRDQARHLKEERAKIEKDIEEMVKAYRKLAKAKTISMQNASKRLEVAEAWENAVRRMTIWVNEAKAEGMNDLTVGPDVTNRRIQQYIDIVKKPLMEFRYLHKFIPVADSVTSPGIPEEEARIQLLSKLYPEVALPPTVPVTRSKTSSFVASVAAVAEAIGDMPSPAKKAPKETAKIPEAPIHPTLPTAVSTPNQRVADFVLSAPVESPIGPVPNEGHEGHEEQEGRKEEVVEETAEEAKEREEEAEEEEEGEDDMDEEEAEKDRQIAELQKEKEKDEKTIQELKKKAGEQEEKRKEQEKRKNKEIE